MILETQLKNALKLSELQSLELLLQKHLFKTSFTDLTVTTVIT